jgi:hypothetical protein
MYVDPPSIPTSQNDPWTVAMRRGDFARAWQVSDACLQARLARGDLAHTGPRHLQSIWDGTPLAGKRVLVRCYHGLGDTVQFIRFMAPLRRIATEVVLWIQPHLLSVADDVDGVDRAIPLHDGIPNVEYDVDIEIMELGHALRIDATTIPTAVPYLLKQYTRPLREPDQELAVGIVWQVGNWAPQRSIPVTLLSPLGRMSGIRLFSLQLGAGADDAWRLYAQQIGVNDVHQTAAQLRDLDLLITVDTFVAHLAGAIGVRVWLLLQHDCDWRWTRDRSDSPWYPTMRLFRQPREGNWISVIEDVVSALDQERARVGCRTFGTNDCM